MKKRAQFFILAAVFISSIVFSLTVAKNMLVGSEKPEDFYLMTEQLDREVRAVLDYQLVSGVDKIHNFTNLSMEYFGGTKTKTDVVFMYLNSSTNLVVENYANSSVNVSGIIGCTSPPCTIAKDSLKSYPVVGNEVVNLFMNGQNFFYSLANGSKSYIVAMRVINKEVYVDVKK